MLILYLACSIATSAVRPSGMLAVSLSISVLTFHWAMKFDSVFFLADFLLSMEEGVEQSGLGIPGDGRSGMSICIVVHIMKAACKYVEVLLAYADYLQHSLGGLTVDLHR